jgi:glycosyltransferase involved in cell wall biosynthesis
MRIFLCPCYPVDLAPHRYAEFERWGLPERADGIWAASDHVAEQASRRFGRPVVPVPSAVDTTRFKPSAEGRAAVRSALGIGDSAPVLLTPAALVERKGIQHVIRALPALQRLYPDVTYLVAGEGPFRGEIEGMIRDLSLDTSVRLLGSVDAVEDLYAASDVVCLLAHGEANPMVIYEALASEVPLVTTDLPPFPDYLTSDVAVLLSSTAPEAVANALHEVLQDGPRRTRMGESGRRLAEERYSYTHVARLVSSLISSPGPDTLEHPAGAEHVQ